MNEREADTARVHLALALVQVLFSGNAVVGRLALKHVSPAAVLAVRIPSAALIFVALRFVWARRAGWQSVARRDLWAFFAAGLLGVSLNQLLFFEGLSRSTATNASVIGASIPVFTAGFSMLLGDERPTWRRGLGLGTALVGALSVALLGRSSGSLRLELGTGELMLIGNSMAYALYLVVSRPLFRRYRTDTAVTWIFGTAALLIAPLALGPLTHELPTAPASAWAALGYIIVGPSVVAYFLNGYALRRAPSSLVAIYIYAQPVMTALLAATVLDEQLRLPTVVGGVLIGSGIALVSLDRAK